MLERLRDVLVIPLNLNGIVSKITPNSFIVWIIVRNNDVSEISTVQFPII